MKYWTSGGYDADSYVQDGLVLNYDGIRNVGLDQPHSTTTTTWVNLGSAGSAYDVERQDTNATGAWTENAFKAAAESYFRTKSDFVFPVTRTMQACFIPTATTHAYIFSPVGTDLWQCGSFQLPGTGKLNFNAHYYKYEDSNAGIPWSAAARPETACANSTSNTATAFLTSDYATITLGTTRPTSGNRSSGYVSLAGGQRSVVEFSAKANIMGNNSTGQLFNGTLFAFRFYNRILDNNELVWNRAVDQARFFGEKPLDAIPVTNAVIASAIANVPGAEAAGAYAVDAEGHTFTAPATQTVDRRAYTCTGYTLEEWDSDTGDWGDPVSQSGTSVAVTSDDKVRITWQWSAGDGIVTRYTTADYVQDGLILHYDGIRNVGADQPHSSDTTEWKNLAPDGGSDLTFRAQTGCTNPGEWRDDGYRFEQQSTFANTASIVLPANQTIQIALNANALDQYALKNGAYANEPYLYYAQTTFGKGAAISLRKDINAAATSVTSTHFDWTVQDYGDSTTRPRPKMTIGAPAKYVTAILADDYGAAMTGTTIPSAQTNQGVMDASRRDFTKGPPAAITASTGFGIGGNYSDTQGKFKGTIHNFRLYNRVLTNEELAQNRVIDDYRFHGVMPVTNVVVSSSHSFLSGNEKSGNYEISGSYTFTAPSGTQTDARGFEYELEGYTIETWDAAALGWSAPVWHKGETSCTYTVGTSPAKVRLTWQWKTTKALRTAADYVLEDIVPTGLALHFDGINNLGAECASTLNPTSRFSQAWVNLADEGEFTLVRVNKTTAAGAWTTDGFAFTNTSSNVGSRFQKTEAFVLTPAYTWQFLLDAKVSDQTDPDGTCGYIMFNDPWKVSSLAVRTKSDYKYGLYYVPEEAFPGGTSAYRPKRLDTETEESEYTWATAILNGNDAMLFAGTTYPTDSVGKKTAPNAATAQTLNKIAIGGGQGTQDFTGKIKNVRYYDRVLTEAELVRNREVDSARYFGVLATTNIVVGAEAYKVEGSYEFEAPATVEVDGVVKDVAGYRLYVLKNGTEEGQPWHRGTTFTYPDDLPADLKAVSATVRLEWEAEPPGLMILIR